MTSARNLSDQASVFESRLIRHASFWLSYYILFSLIWAAPDRGYFASFYLEFVLMPLRILASYCMMYVLIPAFLSHRRLVAFLLSYAALILTAGGLQLLIGHFFYDQLMEGQGQKFALSAASWMRNIVLINSTVILLGAAKVIQLHFSLVDALAREDGEEEGRETNSKDAVIEVKSNRRIHRLRLRDILYVEGMGNYVRYATIDGSRIVVYSSLKAAQAVLPESFIRIHRSYLVNRNHISAYDKETITLGNKTLPRRKDIEDAVLTGDTVA
ncbi:MAG: LytTR family DNA-binding domain-containing protein [Pseudomonadota bacterium]